MADLCVYCGDPAQLDHYQHRSCASCWERQEERCHVHRTPFVVDDDGATFCEACCFAEYLATGGTSLDGYEIVRTDAPRAYDGFGTLHLGEQGRFRTVAVRNEHRQWQVERYASGMYAVEAK